MIAAIVLAAGASTRLGEPKQLLNIGGETLLERTVRVARDAVCIPVVVVLGAAYIQILANIRLADAVPVINDEWQEGMAGSIRLGVRTLGFIAKGAEGVLLMACDQPAITVKHLTLLMTTQEIKASQYAGRNGVPAYFPRKYFPQLTSLTGDAGARTLLAQARSENLLHGELDIDTAEDLAQARKLFG
jgi:molybdenum cofactor cytidylyltransferase